MRRRTYALLAALILAAVHVGCGKADVGGSGRLERVEGGGAGDHLVLEGTPYEMGWWHGHLLKDRIRALHEEWQRSAFARDGDLLSAATQARRKAALALVEPVLQNHLPEAVRQEFQGLSDACGLPVRTLLLTEMITDVLRFTEKEPRLLTGSVDRSPMALGGRWGTLLRAEWIWVTRRSTGAGGQATLLTWPGSLGGVLGARADGVACISVEKELEPGREGLGGTPFRISLRLALETRKGIAEVLAALSRTTGHEVQVLDTTGGAKEQQLLAMTPDEADHALGQPVRLRGEERAAWLREDLAKAPALPGDALPVTLGSGDDGTWVLWASVGREVRLLRVP